MLQAMSGGTAQAPLANGWPQGIDISAYQHPNGAAINWTQVARAGISFAYLKASEGNYYTNRYYAQDYRGARSAALFRGAYHFAIPSATDGVSQADYLMAAAPYYADGRTLPPMMDLEWNPYDSNSPCYGLSTQALVSWISAFSKEILRLTGVMPVIYTATTWWDQCTGGSTAFAGDPLWLASYSSSPPSPTPGWRAWSIWQYTSTGSVPGITGNIDLDEFNPAVGTLAGFAAPRRIARA